MVMNVSSALSAYKQADASGLAKGMGVAKGADGSFADTLQGFMSDAVDSVKHGEEMAAKGAVGKADLQEVILAVSNAEVMMQTITSIRDKVISAYQEVIRTSV
ncbi:MAG: flagellar hook-basal body complex protein FliE [Alphaproteobacteria bacterium]|nr:flagellar hook-basal body complex protein FliE [Alphaproteobacteria bacterium]